MKFPSKLHILAGSFLIAGLVIATPLSYYCIQSKIAVAAAIGTVPTKPLQLKPAVNEHTGQPVAISIPSLNINLQVIPGVYNKNNGEWTLTLDKAQFAEPSVTPNDVTGNTLIYGHYRPQVFAYLHLIKPGAQTVITTSNGYKFTYTYQSSEAFNPTDTSIFSYQGPPRLTIQTCSGAFMQNRQMYFFKYDGYVKV